MWTDGSRCDSFEFLRKDVQELFLGIIRIHFPESIFNDVQIVRIKECPRSILVVLDLEDAIEYHDE